MNFEMRTSKAAKVGRKLIVQLLVGYPENIEERISMQLERDTKN